MSVTLTIVRMATVLNVLLLVGLLYVWVRSYRRIPAQHTLGLVVFATLLLLENLLATYLFIAHPVFSGWLDDAYPLAQRGMMALALLELVALAFLSWITWR